MKSVCCESNYWMHTLLLSHALADQRDGILQKTHDAGLMTRTAWRLMHRPVPYQEWSRAPLSVVESLAQRLINLPSVLAWHE